MAWRADVNRARGLFLHGTHDSSYHRPPSHSPRVLNARATPFALPVSLIMPGLMCWFDSTYFRRAPKRFIGNRMHCESFFCRLNGLRSWSRLCGPRRFQQFKGVMLDPFAAVFHAYRRLNGDAIQPSSQLCGEACEGGSPVDGVPSIRTVAIILDASLRRSLSRNFITYGKDEL